jgi:hypothetical protein
MQITDWLLVEMVLPFGLTHISKTKSGFKQPFVIESPLRLHAGPDLRGISKLV